MAFWNENVDRPLFPYIARVQVANDQIRYFYADPKTQALQDPIVESLEEVIKLEPLTDPKNDS